MVLKTAVDAAVAAPAAPQWVVFRCGGERYGLPLDRVRQIVPPRPLTRLPGTGAEVCGLAGVRGRVVTVVDLGEVLRGQPAVRQADHRLLLLDVAGRRLGVVVDDVVMITPALVTPPTDAEVPRGVVGTGRLEDGGFTALEPGHLIEHLLQ